MSVQNWIANLPMLNKLILGLLVGLLLYGGLRYIIYIANKQFAEISKNAKPQSSLDRLKDLAEGY